MFRPKSAAWAVALSAVALLAAASALPTGHEERVWLVRRAADADADVETATPSSVDDADAVEATTMQAAPESNADTTEVPAEEKEEEEEEEEDGSGAPKITSMKISTVIKLRYAKTKVASRVVNRKDEAKEAVFHVVLPENAFISGFVMEIDGKAYEAKVKEKSTAQNEYQQAIQSGQSAGQVAQSTRDANEFTVSVNVEPKSKVSFNLTYEELLQRRLSVYEHVVHITPGQIIPELSINVVISEGLPIRKITVPEIRNDIQKRAEDEKDNVLAKVTFFNATDAIVQCNPTKTDQLQVSRTGIQGQFVVQYDVERSYTERQGGEIHVIDGYFIHFFAPETLPALKKHVVFVLDTSGSMEGVKLEQTKQAMESILDQLRPDDLFSVIEFSSTALLWDLKEKYKAPDWVFDPPTSQLDTSAALEPVAEALGELDALRAYRATEAAVGRAKLFTRAMRAAGGTNINEALIKAMETGQKVQTETKATPMIIFLTDGDPSVGVTSTQDIALSVKKANPDSLVALYSLAFGSEADFSFLKQLSTQNKAFARKIYEASDATLQLRGFYAEVASPLLSDVHFNYEGTAVSGITVNARGATFFNGSEIVVAGKIDGPGAEASSLRAVVDGLGADGRVVLGRSSSSAGPAVKDEKKAKTTKPSFTLEKSWAYLTIRELLRKAEARDDANVTKQALDLSLKYKFVTPLTSLLVIKPNTTATETALKRADGDDGGEPEALRLTGLRPQSFGYGGTLSNIRRKIAATRRPVSTTTPGSPSFTGSFHSRPLPPPSFVQNDDYVSDFVVAPLPLFELAEEDVAEVEPPAFIGGAERFGFGPYSHNATHVTLPSAGATCSQQTLSWEDVLPDKDFQPCGDVDQNFPRSFCRSLWKCPTLADELTLDDYCVIEGGYVGVCCREEP